MVSDQGASRGEVEVPGGACPGEAEFGRQLRVEEGGGVGERGERGGFDRADEELRGDLTGVEPGEVGGGDEVELL